jgi:hypothetical protein
MAKPFTEILEPIVVSTAEAGRLGHWGKTKVFQLCASGELESFLDGNKRRITTASIRELIRKKLEASTAMQDVSALTEASIEKRRRAKAAGNESQREGAA